YLLDWRPPLEAQLIDVADEIAYNTADLDDGFEARILSLDQIRTEVNIFADSLRQAGPAHLPARAKLQFNEALKLMLDRMVTDLISSTRARLQSARISSVEDVREHPTRLAGFSDEVRAQRRQCKEFLYRELYYCEDLLPEKQHAERVISEMFAYWMAEPQALPRAYQDKAEREPLARVVCDYIAGMTDNFILDQHGRL